MEEAVGGRHSEGRAILIQGRIPKTSWKGYSVQVGPLRIS